MLFSFSCRVMRDWQDRTNITCIKMIFFKAIIEIKVSYYMSNKLLLQYTKKNVYIVHAKKYFINDSQLTNRDKTTMKCSAYCLRIYN